MVEWLKDMVMSRNIVALIISAVILVLLVRLIFNAGKVVLVALGIAGLSAIIYFWFPEFWQGFFRELDRLFQW